MSSSFSLLSRRGTFSVDIHHVQRSSPVIDFFDRLGTSIIKAFQRAFCPLTSPIISRFQCLHNSQLYSLPVAIEKDNLFSTICGTVGECTP
ncbi:hypothetical protein I7I53_00899 [Histoplasma capsulatum var. duboisii H88]|nr:hypothetical protein I7I53_00899 [Histoplasma capsulatum var. duboisii H88]